MPVQCTCQRCGATFSAYPSEIRKGRRYCSSACAYDASSAKSAMTDVDAFWSKVNREGPVPSHCPEIGPCWLWTGALHVDGYGYMGSKRRTPLLAHRRSWEIAYGRIPEEMWVLHKCDNPPCVRPNHLFIGTGQDNVADMMAKGRDRRNPPRGEAHHFARVDEMGVRSIRNLYAAGLSMGKIAIHLNISKSCVQGILEGKNWRHVT